MKELTKIGKYVYACLFLVIIMLPINKVLAKDGVVFSVSPPLFKVDMEPGQIWNSVVKVVNNNDYPTTVYAEGVDFISGDDGGVKFLEPGDQSHARYSLTKWLAIDQTKIDLPAFGSQDVPFKISIPIDANPGGHYASIMIGNQPLDKVDGGTSIKFASRIASLLLVKVKGDVIEKGEIKEFKADRKIFTHKDGKFSITFLNSGNVHVHPTGEIRISNIFGQERGVIEINKSKDFGNILPESEKKWQFAWQGTNSFFDIGPMKAVVALSYGSDVKYSATSSITFWTLDLKPTLIVFGSLFVVILLVVLLIRFYIRRSVESIKRQLGVESQPKKKVKKDKLEE